MKLFRDLRALLDVKRKTVAEGGDGTHFFLNALFFLLELANDEVVLFLFIVVLNLHLRHALSDRPHLFDVWSQLGLLILHLLLDLGD